MKQIGLKKFDSRFEFKLTLDFEVGLAGEVVALPDDAGVAARVVDLRVLDGDGEHVLVHVESVLRALVALLRSAQMSCQWSLEEKPHERCTRDFVHSLCKKRRKEGKIWNTGVEKGLL